MADYPFIALMMETVAANSTATLSYTVATNETLIIHRIRQGSTGAFKINGIRDSRGMQYSNADSNENLMAGIIADIDDANNGILDLPIPLIIPGGVTLSIDVRDTTGGSNEVRFYLVGIRKTGGS